MRKSVIAIALALLLAACGDGASEESSAPVANDAEVAAETTTSAPADTGDQADSMDSTSGDEPEATTAAPADEPSFDGPPAPDFDLALADGSTFNLAAEAKPVYMVFWAEW